MLTLRAPTVVLGIVDIPLRLGSETMKGGNPVTCPYTTE